MPRIPGAPPPDLGQLTRVQDRMTFLYLERCVVHRESNAITATDERGTVHIPAASIGALLFGPGVQVSHHAMMLLGESGATAVWVGERGVRYYAHGRSLARSSRLLQAQAELVTSRTSRLAVAREMYAMRFPDEDTSRLTMQQLRGREGARVRRCYRESAAQWGIRWSGRRYDPSSYDASDAVNQALSAATTALYGVTHAVIVSLGCSPGLGFVHTGHVRSFVFDIADLYKAEYAIPCAFEVASHDYQDVGAETRRAMRDRFHDGGILERCAGDIRRLLLGGSGQDEDEADVVQLWDGADRVVAGGTSYGGFEDVDW